jgi:hypothetical protein
MTADPVPSRVVYAGNDVVDALTFAGEPIYVRDDDDVVVVERSDDATAVVCAPAAT